MEKLTAIKQERLCKIVWNSNNWVNPCERVWNPKYKNDPNKAYEQKTGFVHEDWLFNSQFNIEDFQYGYVKGMETLKSTIQFLDTMYLFSINTKTKERFYVGKLHNIERIKPTHYGKNVISALSDYIPEMVKQLKLVGADYSELSKSPFAPNFRVKTKDIELFQEPIIITDSWFIAHYWRTAPVEITPEISHVLSQIEKSALFNFSPSSPLGKATSYSKHTKSGRMTVSKVHQEIEVSLYNYLLKKGIKSSSIACDTISFGGKLADVVVQISSNSYQIYEIKTDLDLRRGLRAALGQLIDYSNWENNIKVEGIYAVLPFVDLTKSMREFIERIKKSINIKLIVLLYHKANNMFIEA